MLNDCFHLLRLHHWKFPSETLTQAGVWNIRFVQCLLQGPMNNQLKSDILFFERFDISFSVFSQLHPRINDPGSYQNSFLCCI